MRSLVLIASATILCAVSVSAQQSSGTQSPGQDAAATEQRIKDLEERIITLEGQVRMLKSAQPAPPAATTPATPEMPGQAPAPPVAASQQGQGGHGFSIRPLARFRLRFPKIDSHALGGFDAHPLTLSSVPGSSSLYLVACPIWAIALPFLIAPTIWLRRWHIERRRTLEQRGFPITSIEAEHSLCSIPLPPR